MEDSYSLKILEHYGQDEIHGSLQNGIQSLKSELSSMKENGVPNVIITKIRNEKLQSIKDNYFDNIANKTEILADSILKIKNGYEKTLLQNPAQQALKISRLTNKYNAMSDEKITLVAGNYNRPNFHMDVDELEIISSTLRSRKLIDVQRNLQAHMELKDYESYPWKKDIPLLLEEYEHYDKTQYGDCNPWVPGKIGQKFKIDSLMGVKDPTQGGG